MIACDQEETIAFSPMSLISIYPKIGPSCGGTRLNLLCTGVFNTEHLYVGFKWNMNWTITEGSFDKKSKTIWTNTPNFDEYSNNNIPCIVDIMISLDKQTWIKSKFYFIIYQSDIEITNISPKCGCLKGNCKIELQTNVNLLDKYQIFKDFDI